MTKKPLFLNYAALLCIFIPAILILAIWAPHQIVKSAKTYDAKLITRRLTERIYEKYGSSPPEVIYNKAYESLKEEVGRYSNLFEICDSRQPENTQDITEEIWLGVIQRSGGFL